MSTRTIKVELFNPIDFNIVSTYVFLGDKSKQVYNAANSLNVKNNNVHGPNEKILQKEFGKNWRQMFLPKKLHAINGGDAGNSSLGDVYSDILGQILSDSLGDEEVKITEKDIESTELDDKLFEDTKTVVVTDTDKKSINVKQLNIASTKIFNEDTVMDLKEKIYIETLIPPFRQHLFWLDSQNNVVIPYECFVDNIYDVDIRTLTNGELVEGSIYVDKSLYHSKNDIKIIPRDTFILVDELPLTLYVVDLNMFVLANKKMLINNINDKYKTDYIYYGFILKYFPYLPLDVFRTYIINEHEIPVKYPKLSPSKTILRKKYDAEEKIILEANELNVNIPMGITRIFGEVLGTSVVNTRNIFDILSVNESTPEIHAYLSHEDQKYLIKKTYKYNHETYRFPLEMTHGVIVLIKHKEKKSNQIKNIFVGFLPNGNYQIKTTIDDDVSGGFDETISYIGDIVNPLIDKLNMYSNEIGSSYKHVTKHNIHYKSLDINLFWKRSLLDAEYRLVRDLFSEFVSAGMIIDRKFGAIFEFVFSKGMYVFDEGMIENIIKLTTDVKNYYAYMISPDTMEKWDETFGGKHVRMHHRTTDIKFEMLNLVETEYHSFKKYIAYVINHANKALKNTNLQNRSNNVKKLQKLREYDPVLYNLKKYGSKHNYSILCQNPTQPLILTEDELKNMSNKNKEKLVKYWNFTLKKPAYYTCPNPKYPHFNFIIGMHPLNYCMPCCKKVQSKETSKKSKVSEQCLNNHVWDKNIEHDFTRYVSIYGKELAAGRLSKLPPGLSTLFENTSKLNYYLYGVDKGIEIYTMEINSFINIIKIYTKLDQLFVKLSTIDLTIYKQLLNGKLINILQYDEFSKYMIKLSKKDKNFNVMDIHNKLTTELLIELLIEGLARLETFGIIIFNESQSFYISPFVKTSNKIKHYILLNKLHNSYSIICLVEPEKFFTRGDIHTKMFAADSKTITTLFDIIEYESDEVQYDKLIDLNIIKKFCVYDKIILKYISNYNLCYGVLIDSKIGKYYMPVNFSANVEDNIPISLDIPNVKTFAKMNLKFSTLHKKIDAFNAAKFKNYRKILIDNMITIEDNSTNEFLHDIQVFKFGVQDGRFNEFFKKSIKVPMAHSLDDVNFVIKNMLPPQIDKLNTDLGKAYYTNLKYQLFYNEFLTHMQKERNTSLRNKIKNTRNVEELLKYYPDDYELLKTNNLSQHFSFDYVTLHKLHKLDKKDIIKQLKDIVKEFVVIGKINYDEFPNVYLSCNVKSDQMYCKGKKLIIDDNLDQLIDLLASDISNPIKFSYMLKSITLNENIIEYFHFKQYPDELLTINII
jgi:hypothetical protein